ncbi:MAG: TatD family nuclease-associated radical SAM protein [Clostridia bacterium]|nr:TatD family nuclease-associated radical SAM protein [Clostridia bacterium]
MKDTYVYELDGNLYVNLTNRCSNDCKFCVRNGKESYYGHKLWLSAEPTVEQVLKSIKHKEYNEVVFCGFGEPTFRVKEMVEIARILKEKGYKTRLNTNGHGNLINGEDITVRLQGVIDRVNVSLNAPDENEYFDVCRPVFGENAFSALIDFAVKCKNLGIDVNFSVVDCIGEKKVAKCKRLAKEVGVPLRVRKMIEDSDAT